MVTTKPRFLKTFAIEADGASVETMNYIVIHKLVVAPHVEVAGPECS